MSISSAEEDARLLLGLGESLLEPIAWRGPIVMNTQEEFRVVWRELEEESLVKHGGCEG